MRTVTIIVIILFLVASIFLGLFITKISSTKLQASSPASTTKLLTDTASTSEEENASSKKPGDEISTTQPQLSSMVEKVEVYLDGTKDQGGIFLGEANYGIPSPEAASIYGEKFSNSGYSLLWKNTNYNFEPGSTHNIFIYTYIPKFGWDYIRKTFVVPGERQQSPNIRFFIDTPENGAVISQDINIGGWAVNLATPDSPGITSIEFYLDGPRGFGKSLGNASLGTPRQDVADAMGNQAYLNSGFNFLFSPSQLEPGSDHSIYAYAISTTGEFSEIILNIKIDGEKKSENSIIFVQDDFAIEIEKGLLNINGWAVPKNYFEEITTNLGEKEYSVKKIVFTSTKNGNEDIFIMNIDGSDLTQLTDNPSNDMYPQVTPDGKKIIYTSDINGIWQIMIMNADGSNKKQLTNARYRSGYPTMTFDGNYIFYEAYIDNNWEIYRMNSDGTNPARLTFSPNTDDWHPFAHPLEFKIIYESGSIGSEDIFFMDYDGHNIKRVLDFSSRKRVPCISKDGKFISFAGYEQETASIYIVNSDGTNLKRLTNNPSLDTHPSISADNKYIAFDSNLSGNHEIYIMNFDGTNLRQLTNIPGDDWGAVFLYQQ